MAIDRHLDEGFCLRHVERLDLDLLEEVVPGAALALPMFLDRDSRNHRDQALRKRPHEEAA